VTIRANFPDPERLGGLGWARRTGGRLTSRERVRLLAAIALGQWENVLGRAKLALGRLPAGAANVDLETFTVPDSQLAWEAEQACAEQPAALVGHSYRTWLFGRALAAVDGANLDPETYRVTVDDAIEMGDRVVVLVRAFATIAGSDTEVNVIAATVYTVHDGQITCIEFYDTRAEALKAVELED